MNHCIYLKDNDQNLLAFDSEEHIFPAAIGGIQKLPASYVSREANNGFSGQELIALRDSILAIPREFHGPGKRGNLNPKRASSSNICLMHNNTENPDDFVLGYMKLSEPYLIPQLKVNIIDSQAKIIANPSEENSKSIGEFIEELREYSGRYTLIHEEIINPNEFILGFDKPKKRWYLALSNNDLILDVDKWVSSLLSEHDIEKKPIIEDGMRPKMLQHFQLTESDYRVFAKISFNFLAYITSQEFVTRSNLDPIRNWILNGGKNNFVKMLKYEQHHHLFGDLDLPELAHAIMIVNKYNRLRGYISFYGGAFSFGIDLGNTIPQDFIADGFICDWENRKEYRLLEYVNMHKRTE